MELGCMADIYIIFIVIPAAGLEFHSALPSPLSVRKEKKIYHFIFINNL